MNPETAPGRTALLLWREDVRPNDVAAIRALVAETGVFSAAEIDIAGELAGERLTRGADSGYHFVFAEASGVLVAYACFGPIPGTDGSFDLYWIAARRTFQRSGLAREALRRAEQAAIRLGARRMFIDTSSSPPYEPARGLYRTMGYEQVALLPDFYRPGDGKTIFAKRLTA